jgi:hypothetical protein
MNCDPRRRVQSYIAIEGHQSRWIRFECVNVPEKRAQVEGVIADIRTDIQCDTAPDEHRFEKLQKPALVYALYEDETVNELRRIEFELNTFSAAKHERLGARWPLPFSSGLGNQPSKGMFRNMLNTWEHGNELARSSARVYALRGLRTL